MKSFFIAKTSTVIAAVVPATSDQALSCSTNESQDIAASNRAIQIIDAVVLSK